MTTYTVTTADGGDVLGRGLSVTAAAHLIMSWDGQVYEIRPVTGHDVDGAPLWEMWTGRQDEPLSRTALPMVWERTEAQAWQELAAWIVLASPSWRGRPVATPVAKSTPEIGL